jgi:hypothetical protein
VNFLLCIFWLAMSLASLVNGEVLTGTAFLIAAASFGYAVRLTLRLRALGA